MYSGAIEGHIECGYQESYTCSVGLSGSHTVRLFRVTYNRAMKGQGYADSY